jgi:hypothetical protein
MRKAWEKEKERERERKWDDGERENNKKNTRECKKKCNLFMSDKQYNKSQQLRKRRRRRRRGRASATATHNVLTHGCCRVQLADAAILGNDD